MNKNSETGGPLKAVFPGKYIQDEHALAMLPGLIGLLGSKGIILASPTAKNRILPKYFPESGNGTTQVEAFGGECCTGEIERILALTKQTGADVLVGMGGGKAIDTAKIVADRAGIPVIVVPTIASTDAPCSGCAVIYTREGVFESVYYQRMNPHVVLVDMTVMAAAPVRFLVSGMGDALATWFEARSCVESHSPNACGGYSTLAALNLAKLCYDTLLAYGPAARSDNEKQIITPALHHVVEANTLLSGLGFESAGLAAAHSVHNGLTALPETHAFYHGEKVAFGVITGLHLTGAPADELETVYSFCRKVGLPTTFAGIGIGEVTREKLMKVALKACDPADNIGHEVVRATPDMVLEAMIAADAMGKKK
jgi:glycerol dehydrogenase